MVTAKVKSGYGSAFEAHPAPAGREKTRGRRFQPAAGPSQVLSLAGDESLDIPDFAVGQGADFTIGGWVKFPRAPTNTESLFGFVGGTLADNSSFDMNFYVGKFRLYSIKRRHKAGDKITSAETINERVGACGHGP